MGKSFKGTNGRDIPKQQLLISEREKGERSSSGGIEVSREDGRSEELKKLFLATLTIPPYS